MEENKLIDTQAGEFPTGLKYNPNLGTNTYNPEVEMQRILADRTKISTFAGAKQANLEHYNPTPV